MIFEIPLEHLPQGASCSRLIGSAHRAPPRMNGLMRQNSISGTGLQLTRNARPFLSLTLATAHLLHNSTAIGGFCRSTLERCCRWLPFGGQSTGVLHSTRFWRQLNKSSREFSLRR